MPAFSNKSEQNIKTHNTDQDNITQRETSCNKESSNHMIKMSNV